MPATYKEKTYQDVLCWKADTKLTYGPNPKRGKSQLRYARYMSAKTVAEALEKGSYPQDLFFDYEHGYIKVSGPRRRKPLDSKDEEESWTKVDKMLAQMHRAYLLWQKTFKMAEELGVDRRQLTSDKTNGESTEVRVKRLTAAAMARMVLEDVEQRRRKVTDSDVLAVLRLWGFRENTNRLNVMQEGQTFVYSDTLGLVTGRDGSVCVTQATTAYSDVTQVFTRWLQDHVPPELKKSGFGCTSINVNSNYAAALHRDGNNAGPSMIKAFGQFTGGCLNYWGDDDKTLGTVEKMCEESDKSSLDIKANLALFDGNRGHSVDAFEGERFSLVFFCVGLWDRSSKKVKSELARCGFTPPTTQSMAKASGLLGKPRGYRAARAAGSTRAPVLCWAVDEKKESLGAQFLTKGKAQEARKLGLAAMEEGNCTDKDFVGQKTKYSMMDDGRRVARVFLVGESGGELLAVTGEEEKKGTGRYLYEKVCKVGPPMSSTHRMTDVRAWASKVVKHETLLNYKRCIKSKAADEEEERPSKRARNAGA